jgi:predicted RNA binding protein YcfA (HicA-like mRNA interferase family)
MKTFGYNLTRQSGSHMRLTTSEHGEHHITIPRHDPLRIGTLAAIVSDVAAHFNLSREVVINRLFGTKH